MAEIGPDTAIVSPPAFAMWLPITSDTGLVGSATMTHGWRFEM